MARTVSITYIIRKYGLRSKRLYPKNRVKYEKAIEMLKAFGNQYVEIFEIIDNVLYPERSVSDHCQVEGCNHAIRWEYVLKNKVSDESFVAGSTCVWPILGLSEIEIKRFSKMQNVLQEFHDKIMWEQSNADVVEKLNRMREHELYQYRPYWEEINYCKLCDEDTEYIRNADVDALIASIEKAKKEEEERKERRRLEREKAQKEWDVIKGGLMESVNKMVADNYGGYYMQSIKRQLENSTAPLMASTVEHIKGSYNAWWFGRNVSGTEKDMTDVCEDKIREYMEANQDTLNCRDLLHMVDTCRYTLRDAVKACKGAIESLITSTGDTNAKWVYMAYRVKHNIILK